MRILLLCLLPYLAGARLSGQQFDLVIANGEIFDGAGNPWSAGDIGIRGDSIAAIGHLAKA